MRHAAYECAMSTELKFVDKNTEGYLLEKGKI